MYAAEVHYHLGYWFGVTVKYRPAGLVQLLQSLLLYISLTNVFCVDTLHFISKLYFLCFSVILSILPKTTLQLNFFPHKD